MSSTAFRVLPAARHPVLPSDPTGRDFGLRSQTSSPPREGSISTGIKRESRDLSLRSLFSLDQVQALASLGLVATETDRFLIITCEGKSSVSARAPDHNPDYFLHSNQRPTLYRNPPPTLTHHLVQSPKTSTPPLPKSIPMTSPSLPNSPLPVVPPLLILCLSLFSLPSRASSHTSLVTSLLLPTLSAPARDPPIHPSRDGAKAGAEPAVDGVEEDAGGLGSLRREMWRERGRRGAYGCGGWRGGRGRRLEVGVGVWVGVGVDVVGGKVWMVGEEVPRLDEVEGGGAVVGSCAKAAMSDERRRGRKPGREAVPPVRRIVDASGKRRSIGSWKGNTTEQKMISLEAARVSASGDVAAGMD